MNRTIELAPDFSVPRIITGLWQIADIERKEGTVDPAHTAAHLAPYVTAGLNTFDMADHYGSSEIVAGMFKKKHPGGDQVQLFTKWVPKPGSISKNDVRDAVQHALNRMQVSTIDLLQFHAWRYSNPSWLNGMFFLEELKEEGLIKHLGVTNLDTIHLKMLLDSGIQVVTNQVCHSLIDQRAMGKLRTICVNYGVRLLAFGTLAGGFLTDKWLDRPEPKIEELKTWSEMKYKRFIDASGGWDKFQNLLNSCRSIADKHQVSIANIAARYVLDNPAVASIIVGARPGKSEHIKDNLRILKIVFDDEDRQIIQDAQSQLDPIPGDCGDEYRYPPFLTASGDLSHHLNEMPFPYEPIQKDEHRSQVFSGTSWEGYAGYCRAVREGNRILVSGTTATHEDKMIGGNDPASQTHFVIDKIQGAIESLGGTLDDVVRTRIYVHYIEDWEPIARAHGERFRMIQPANTLVQANLIGDGYKVEIESEAVVR